MDSSMVYESDGSFRLSVLCIDAMRSEIRVWKL
jgi:hypothetical protein